MKKYVITEAQLKTIVNELDLSRSVVRSKPMSFQNFINAIEMEKGGEKSDVGDLKSFVSAKMAGDRAKDYLNKTDDALDKIAGGSGIKGYSIVNDDPVLIDANKVSIIILSLVYYFYKKGDLPRFKKPQVSIDLDKNNNILKSKGFDDFKLLLKVELKADFNPVDINERETIISTPDGLIQVHVNTLGMMATSVKLSFMDSTTLNKFYNDVLTNKDVINKIQKAINKRTKPELKDGSLIFNF